jgi:hypothetical protein
MDGEEKCQRCGEEGEDRRTLWMACFYAMEELQIPFGETVLFHAKTEELEPAREPVAVETSRKEKIVLQSGTMRSSGELTPQHLYTLRVCKDCRADWLDTIRSWFTTVNRKQSPGTGVWIRENGTNREATPEEVENMIRDRERK